MYKLWKDGIVIEDYGGQGKANYNFGCYFKNSGLVSDSYWNLDPRQLNLDRLHSCNLLDSNGGRVGVRIFKS